MTTVDPLPVSFDYEAAPRVAEGSLPTAAGRLIQSVLAAPHRLGEQRFAHAGGVADWVATAATVPPSGHSSVGTLSRRLKAIRWGHTILVEHRYGADGVRSESIFGNGLRTAYQHHPASRTVSTVSSDGWRFHGQCISGSTTQFAYDCGGPTARFTSTVVEKERALRIQFPDGIEDVATADAAGQMAWLGVAIESKARPGSHAVRSQAGEVPLQRAGFGGWRFGGDAGLAELCSIASGRWVKPAPGPNGTLTVWGPIGMVAAQLGRFGVLESAMAPDGGRSWYRPLTDRRACLAVSTDSVALLEYDPAGRLVRMRDSLGGFARLTWSDDGRRLRREASDGRVDVEFDTPARLKFIRRESVGGWELRWSADGRLDAIAPLGARPGKSTPDRRQVMDLWEWLAMMPLMRLHDGAAGRGMT